MNDIGYTIKRLRLNNKLTQKDIASKLNITEQAVSKWERGYGLPDISILEKLSIILNTNVNDLISGEVTISNNNSNMCKINIYVCPKCNNVIVSTSELSLSCCGVKLVKEIPSNMIDFTIDSIEDEYYVKINHEMSKDNYISFVIYVTNDKVYINKLYPEQSSELSFRKMGHGYIYVYSNNEGLSLKKI